MNVNFNNTTNLKVLDCTLRDGGHVNKWDFGEKNIRSIIINLVKAKIDIIELGLLKNIANSNHKSLKPDLNDFEGLLKELEISSSQEFTVMVRPDWINDYSIFNRKEENLISGIRFAFYQKDLKLVYEQAKIAKDNGYKIYLNPVAISTYSEKEIIEVLELLIELSPNAFSIVDTFGAFNSETFLSTLILFEKLIPENILIGVHLHENQSLARHLISIFLSLKKDSRKYIIDASLLGMGRIPGNLCIEQLVNELNKTNQKYKPYYLYKIIHEVIAPIKKITPWGYSPEYFISALNNINRNYAEYFIKEKLSIEYFQEACQFIAKKSKNNPIFDESLAEEYLKNIFLKDN